VLAVAVDCQSAAASPLTGQGEVGRELESWGEFPSLEMSDDLTTRLIVRRGCTSVGGDHQKTITIFLRPLTFDDLPEFLRGDLSLFASTLRHILQTGPERTLSIGLRDRRKQFLVIPEVAQKIGSSRVSLFTVGYGTDDGIVRSFPNEPSEFSVDDHIGGR
jgi:hypothetical protein